MAEISYLPGEGTAIVAGDTVVLLDAPADAPICTGLWRLAAGGASYERLRAVIESSDPARLPDLGLARMTAEGAFLLLRGSVRASITDDISTMDYSDDGHRGWREHGPVPPGTLRLRLRDTSGPALPLVGGVVRCDAVVVGEATEPVSAPPVVAPPAPVAAPPPPMQGVFVEREATSTTIRAGSVSSLADVWVTAPQPVTTQPVVAPPTAPPTAEPTVAPTVTGPTVRATLCPNQHANPPDAQFCRLCRAPILDRELSIVARPPLGRLDFGALGWVPLDRDILIGSDPGEQPADGPRPVLIAHPAVAARHVEVRVHDWTVTVIDLDSPFGTALVLPGRTPQPLLSRYPAPIVPGTVVYLGQQVPFTYVV